MKKKRILGLTTTVLFYVMLMLSACAGTKPTEKSKQYEYMNVSSQASATVTSVDYKTRKVTLMIDGEPYSFVASDDVKNLNQVKKGDKVNAKYTEAVAFNINKGGKMASPKMTESAWTARPGEKPEAGLERKVTTTVIITNIDRAEPSVTIKGASGETKTLKVMHPERLEGVKVGDAVDITYSEALALKLEKKTNQ